MTKKKRKKPEKPFSRTIKAVKEVPLLAFLSYLVAAIVISEMIRDASTWGGWSYIFTMIILPVAIKTAGQFARQDLLGILIEDWRKIPNTAHILIILDIIIAVNLFKTYQLDNGKLWLKEWILKTSGK